ncbi:F-box DNA helicase 1 [Parasteatoda tepidariorum]|uniref:F-box DNA helicase 1 n=1 Tax=Parasteatoda tepidariorum TaxID=114398 RepID=UPI0039BC916C
MSSKQPRKKRRIDDDVGEGCVVHCNAKTLFDSTMYHRKLEPKKSLGNASSSFVKASDLIKTSLNKNSPSTSACATADLESSDSDSNMFETLTPKRLRKSDATVIAKDKFRSASKIPVPTGARHLRSRTVSGSGKASRGKISNYFKPVPGTKSKKILAKSVRDVRRAVDDKKLGESRNEMFFKKVQNCYGLFGDLEECDEDQPNYFERLPEHIIETILCQIPMLDLLNCRCVSKLWNSVINNSKFIDWKKLYYKIKMKDSRALLVIKHKAHKYGLKNVEDAFIVFIKYMSEGFLRKPSRGMYDLLIKNEKAVIAELVLEERFPDLCKKESKPWSIFAMAILLSETVWDIYGLYKSLFPKNSDCNLHDVINALYCAAAFLIHFRNTLHLNYGLHYRVYYAIYMIENTLPSKRAIGTQTLKVPKGLPGQQSIHSYCDSSNSQLTYEQLRILNHCIQPNQVIKIVALAGTGKTTTLIHLAQLYPQVKFLNVMYNKAICEDAKKRFPSNVVCKTAHSLAYATEGLRLRYKLTSKVKPHDLVTLLTHKEGTKLHVFSYAKLVLSTLESFVCSADEEITFDHIPMQDSNSKSITDADKVRLLKDSKLVWSKMIDREEKSARITHDVYLKLYQLSKPSLSQYQCIMVDEAQDCNPAMISVVLSQKLPVILVGDPNQQIYGFRGAKNALQSIKATHTYHLTKSFRFGPEIAYIASSCLESLKHVTTNTLVGNEKPSYVNSQAVGQYAIIARSNVMLFNEAVRLCCQKRIREHEPSTINAAFVGGIEGYGFQQLLDICKLANYYNEPGYVIKDKFISKFKTYEELTNYAKNADDSDLLSKVELIRLHSNDIPQYIKTIKEKCTHPLQLANVVFSTAHKSKGLEFDTVSLTDDYPVTNWGNLRRRGSISSGTEEEEYNVIYVALTRAKTSLFLPERFFRVFLSGNEKFEYPVLSKQIAEPGQAAKCVVCNEMFTPHTVLALYRRQMTLANGRRIQGGVLCMKCRTDPKVRTRVELDPVIMYLDPTDDYAHRSMASLVGPLPNDPPIVHNSFPPFQDRDVVYIINIHV